MDTFQRSMGSDLTAYLREIRSRHTSTPQLDERRTLLQNVSAAPTPNEKAALVIQACLNEQLCWVPWAALKKLDKKAAALVQHNRQLRSAYQRELDEMTMAANSKRVLVEPRECICGGTGWVGMLVAISHPDFGRMVRCVCRKAEDADGKREWLWNQSGLYRDRVDRLPPPGFSAYTPRDKTQSDAKALAIAWSQGEGKPALLITGLPGLGKSHLAKAAIAAVIGRGERGVYIEMANLVTDSKKHMDNNTYGEWWESLLQAKYLALDDIGREYATPWTRASMYELVNRRWAGEMRTFYTSNFTLGDLHKSGDVAVLDRLSDVARTEYVEVEGDSMRAQPRNELVEEIPW